jgi:hypothetical protein
MYFFAHDCKVKVSLKSVHFKNTVVRSSVLSKLCLADFVLISANVLLKMIIRTEDCTTVFLKWTDFRQKELFMLLLCFVQLYLFVAL